MTLDARNYSAAEVLRDGSAILIRSIRPDDKQHLLDHFAGLSEQSVYYRFLAFKRSLSAEELWRLTELDFITHVGLAATMRSNGDERFIGVGRYLSSDDRSQAEVAFAVLDEYQGRGIGTLLLKHLGRIASAAGVRQFVAYVLGGNQKMLEVFANSGFRAHDFYESGVVRVVLDLDSSPA